MFYLYLIVLSFLMQKQKVGGLVAARGAGVAICSKKNSRQIGGKQDSSSGVWATAMLQQCPLAL